MSALHQMGHDSRNLLVEVPGFTGAIASPVNSGPQDVAAQIASYRPEGFTWLLDPQLYFPRSDRGRLREWGYFPQDFDTADMTASEAWRPLASAVLDQATALGVNEVCSPVTVPAVYTEEYFALCTSVGSQMAEDTSALKVLQSVVVRLEELASPGRPEEIGSIVSATRCAGIYLVLCSQVPPRQEYTNAEELKGAMRLIAGLKEADIHVTVPYSGSEAILWAAAGASRCATGKFFNLRRFTPGRWDDPQQGGGQVPYWFEEGLFAFLRQGDLIRLLRRGAATPEVGAAMADASSASTFAQEILDQFSSNPGAAWQALSWRQYMSCFAELQRRMAEGSADASILLTAAENNWGALANLRPPFLMEEPRNDGRWIRPWRIALAEYSGGY